MIREFLDELARGFNDVRVASYTLLRRIVSPTAARISIATGFRPQSLAYAFLIGSLVLDVIGEAHYAPDVGLDFGWGFALTIHVAVMVSIIEIARDLVKQVERHEQPKLTKRLMFGVDLATLWTLLTMISLVAALGHALFGTDMFMAIQSIENIFDLLTIGFGMTLITKPPSLLSRLRNRANNWKPTFIPAPQGV